MSEGVLDVVGSVSFLLLFLWFIPNLWTINGANKAKKEERERSARRRRKSVLQPDSEIRQKELEIEETFGNLATGQYHPDIKLLKEVELHKKMLELQLLAAPLGKEERRQLDDEMTVVRGQIEEQKKKLNMSEKR
jgi:hypothetical protein